MNNEDQITGEAESSTTFRTYKRSDFYDVDSYLSNNLDKEGLIRLKTVELTVKFFENKPVSDIKVFNEQFEKIYKFLTMRDGGEKTTGGV